MVRVCYSSTNVGGLMSPNTTFLMSVLLRACATVPHSPSYYEEREQVEGERERLEAGEPEKVEAPRCTDICWVMLARNDNFYEARVYIGGQRVARLPGMMAKDVAIPIRRSMLDGTGCMVVFVELYPDTKAAYSSKQCPVPGRSRLELAIAESCGGHPLQLWLQDWQRR
jgi:hypothetical protein